MEDQKERRRNRSRSRSRSRSREREPKIRHSILFNNDDSSEEDEPLPAAPLPAAPLPAAPLPAAPLPTAPLPSALLPEAQQLAQIRQELNLAKSQFEKARKKEYGEESDDEEITSYTTPYSFFQKSQHKLKKYLDIEQFNQSQKKNPHITSPIRYVRFGDKFEVMPYLLPSNAPEVLKKNFSLFTDAIRMFPSNQIITQKLKSTHDLSDISLVENVEENLHAQKYIFSIVLTLLITTPDLIDLLRTSESSILFLNFMLHGGKSQGETDTSSATISTLHIKDPNQTFNKITFGMEGCINFSRIDRNPEYGSLSKDVQFKNFSEDSEYFFDEVEKDMLKGNNVKELIPILAHQMQEVYGNYKCTLTKMMLKDYPPHPAHSKKKLTDLTSEDCYNFREIKGSIKLANRTYSNIDPIDDSAIILKLLSKQPGKYIELWSAYLKCNKDGVFNFLGVNYKIQTNYSLSDIILGITRAEKFFEHMVGEQLFNKERENIILESSCNNEASFLKFNEDFSSVDLGALGKNKKQKTKKTKKTKNKKTKTKNKKTKTKNKTKNKK